MLPAADPLLQPPHPEDAEPFVEQRLSKTGNTSPAPRHRARRSIKIPLGAYASLASEHHPSSVTDAFVTADDPFVRRLQTLEQSYLYGGGRNANPHAPASGAALARASVRALCSLVMSNQDELHKPITALTKAAQGRLLQSGTASWLVQPGFLLHDAESPYVRSGPKEFGPFGCTYEEPGYDKTAVQIVADIVEFIRHLDRKDARMLDFPTPGKSVPVVVSALPPKLLWKMLCASVAAREKTVTLKLWRRMAHIPNDDGTCRFLFARSVDELVEHFGITTNDYELLADLEDTVGFLALRLRLPGTVELLLRVALESTAFRHSKCHHHASCMQMKNMLATIVVLVFDGLYAGTWYMYDGVSPIVGEEDPSASERADKLSRFHRWHRMCKLAMEIVGAAMPPSFVSYEDGEPEHWNAIHVPTKVHKPQHCPAAAPSARWPKTLRIALGASAVTQWPFRAMMALPATWFRAIDLLDVCYLLAACKAASHDHYRSFGRALNSREFGEAIMSSATREELLVAAYAKLVEVSRAGQDGQRSLAIQYVHQFWCVLPYEFLMRSGSTHASDLDMPDIQAWFSNAPACLNESGRATEYEGEELCKKRSWMRGGSCKWDRQTRQRLNEVNADWPHQSMPVFWHEHYPYYWHADVDHDPSGRVHACSHIYSAEFIARTAGTLGRVRNFHPGHDGARARAHGSQAALRRLVNRLLGEMPDAPREDGLYEEATVSVCVAGMANSIACIAKAMKHFRCAAGRTAGGAHFVEHIKSVLDVYLDTIGLAAAQDARYLRNATPLLSVPSLFMAPVLCSLAPKYLDLANKIADHVFDGNACPIAEKFAAVWMSSEAQRCPNNRRLHDAQRHGWQSADRLFLGNKASDPALAALLEGEHAPVLEDVRQVFRAFLFEQASWACFGADTLDGERWQPLLDTVFWLRDFVQRHDADSARFVTCFNWMGPKDAFAERREWFARHGNWVRAAKFKRSLHDGSHALTRILKWRDVARNGCGLVEPAVPQTKRMLEAFDDETEELFRAVLRICDEPEESYQWTLAVAASMRWDIGARVLSGPFQTRTDTFKRGIGPHDIPEWMLSYLEHDVAFDTKELADDRVRSGIARPCPVSAMRAYLEEIGAAVWAPGSAAAATLDGLALAERCE